MLVVRSAFAPQPDTTMRIFEFICTFIQKKTYPPSFREIAAGCYISTAGVTRHLDKLEQRGLLWREYRKARAIKLTA